MLSNREKAALHIAAKDCGVDKALRRVIQRNVGGFYSAADRSATHTGFAAVMAYYERELGGKLPRYTAGYWSGQVGEMSGPRGDTSRLRWRIDRESRRLGWTGEQVDTFLAGPHCSSGRYTHVADCSAYWLGKLVDALIAMGKRRDEKGGGGTRQGRRDVARRPVSSPVAAAFAPSLSSLEVPF